MSLMNLYRARKHRFRRRLDRFLASPFLRQLTGRPANRQSQIAPLFPELTQNGLKILCFGPYTRFTTHSAAETILLHAMRMRGHSTTYVMCDGKMPQCDIYRTGIEVEDFLTLGPYGEKSGDACRQCQSISRHALWEFGMPTRKMGEWLTGQDYRKAKAWAAQLPDVRLVDAKFNDWPIGEWVTSSVRTHFRCNEIDIDAPGTIGIFRRYLVSGALTALFFERCCEELQPDVMLLFNGRMAPTRVALELAKLRGIRTIVEERGLTNHVRLWENEDCTSLEPLDRMWSEWKDIPLSVAEAQQTVEILSERRHGRGFEWRAFSQPAEETGELARKLGLDGRPVWLAMTSSIDESGQDGRAKGLFPSQDAWIEALVEIARQRPDIQLVVRVHPNIGSANSVGVNNGEISYFQNLAGQVPANVTVIPSAAQVSTYGLMDVADAGFIWHTTAGLEMAATGKQVFQSGGMFMGGKEFLTPLSDGPDLAARIFASLEAWDQHLSRHAVRLALRCAQILFYRQAHPLPLMKQLEWYASTYSFSDNSCLLPGRTKELDHLAEILEGTRPIYPSPTDADRSRRTEAEDAILDRIVSHVPERFTEQIS